MFRLSAGLLGLVFLFALPGLTSAQETTPAEAEAAKVSEKQAFELLETISDGIPSLHTLENRVYVTNAVADLLWSKDEKRARSLFDTLTREMVAAVASVDPSDREHYNDLGVIQQQRREIIERMARHDPEMAMAFLRATRLVPSESTRLPANETELEFHLAGLIAQNDPAQALRLARASLRKGMPYGAAELVSQIDAKDRDSARALHGEIVDQIKNEDLSRNGEVANTAWNLLTSYQPPQAKEETYRELIEVLVSAVLSATSKDSNRVAFGQNYYGQLQAAMPQIEKYAPARVPALRQWLQSFQRTQDPGSRMFQEVNELVQKGTVDDIVTLANRYGPEYQTHIYQQASMKALSSGDPNRARQIISELVTDPAQRREMLDQIDNQVAWNTINENKIGEARRMVSRLKDVEQRVNLLMSMAMNVAARNDKKQALELLAEARTLLDASPQDAGKLMMRLQLAQNYSSLDLEQCVALLESIVLRVNQLVAAAVVLDGFENRYLKEGEWLKTSYSSVSGVINNLDRSLAQLASRDPASACYLSSQLERPEIRMMAQLEIAQSLLADTQATDRPMPRRFVRFNR